MTEQRRKRGRPRAAIPPVEVTISLPLHVKNILYTKLRDPVYDKLLYGALSEYVTSLIVADLRRQGHPVLPPGGEPGLTPDENRVTITTQSKEPNNDG